MKRRLIVLVLAAVALIATGAVAGRLLYRAYPVQMSLFAGLLRDPQTAAIKTELKWLASELGPARIRGARKPRHRADQEKRRASGSRTVALPRDYKEAPNCPHAREVCSAVGTLWSAHARYRRLARGRAVDCAAGRSCSRPWRPPNHGSCNRAINATLAQAP